MEDEDGEVERCCRICRGPEEEEVDGEEAGEALGKLIRPCACKGSLLYVHEKCQEMWIKTYIRRSDKKPACEVCGQQFRISFTQPHKGLVGFLFSSQSPPLVHAIYLSLLYIGLEGGEKAEVKVERRWREGGGEGGKKVVRRRRRRW